MVRRLDKRGEHEGLKYTLTIFDAGQGSIRVSVVFAFEMKNAGKEKIHTLKRTDFESFEEATRTIDTFAQKSIDKFKKTKEL